MNPMAPKKTTKAKTTPKIEEPIYGFYIRKISGPYEGKYGNFFVVNDDRGKCGTISGIYLRNPGLIGECNDDPEELFTKPEMIRWNDETKVQRSDAIVTPELMADTLSINDSEKKHHKDLIRQIAGHLKVIVALLERW